MKKRTYCFFLVLCIAFGLLPAALATDSGAAGSNAFQVVISDLARTSTGLQCKVGLQGFQSGDAFWAAVFEESGGVPGKMKDLREIPVSTASNSVSVALGDVSDGDFVRLMWLSREGVVRDCRTVARPTSDTSLSSGVREASGKDFDELLLQLLRRESANAATEKALEEAAEQNPYAYKRLIVKLKSGQRPPNLSDFGDPLVIYNPATGYAIIQLSDEDKTKNCEAYLKTLPAIVEYVETDRLMKSGPQASGAYLDMSAAFNSWGVREMKADVLAETLQRKSGLPSVVVAVADTGVQADHPFLKDRLTAGFDFIENDDDPQDQHSHGTHVAGTIVDCTPGLDIKIMPLRVLSASGGGTATAIAMAVRYAVSHGAGVINMSLGGQHSAYLDEAIEAAIASGVTVVVAAGNEGESVAAHCPAHIDNAITVGAVDNNMTKASFSNSGPELDVVAPGVAIRSSILDSKFGEKNGTSMATPHVTAAVAMLRYGYPGKTPAEIQQALRDTATDLGKTGRDDDYGYGFPNLELFASGWPSGSGGTEPNPSQDPEPKDGLFALLYSDGELVFQNNNQPRRDTQVSGVYSIEGELPTESGTFTGTDNGTPADGGDISFPGWYEQRQKITKVTILDKMRPVSTAQWFRGCENLRSITGMECLSTSLVTDMRYMFAECRALTEINLFAFNTATVTDMSYMFYNCSALTTIRVTKDTFDTGAVTNSANMFTGAVKLVGGQGTVYDAAHVDKAYARNDAGHAAPGYFSEPESVHLTALLYGDGELVFQSDATPAAGRTVVKTYAADSYGHGDDPDSCAWRDEAAQIKTVTFATRIQPESVAQWFQDCYNLTAVQNLENLDTSRVQDMSAAFARCISLTALDLSALDTSAATDMSGMFKHCFNLTRVDLSSFDTAKVANVKDMFHGCEKLQTIYASEKFVADNAVSNHMFTDCLKLVGGSQTAYDETHTSADYARLDGGAAKPGYFTQKGA